jgi:AcrR family transcriptional regulator
MQQAVMPPPRKRKKRPTVSASELERRLDGLWRRRPSRGARSGLTLDHIVATAMEIARTRGVGELSMRELAGQLGSGAMSLYRHVRSKEELLNLMADAAVGSPPVLGDQPENWRAKLERWARAEWAVFMRQPWALQVVTRPLMGPGRMSWLEAALGALAETGLSDGERLEVISLVDRYVRGAALDASRRAQDGSDWYQHWAASLARFLTEASRRGQSVNLSRLMTNAQAIGGPPSSDYELDFGLERVLDGVAALVDRRRLPSRRRR